MLPSRHQDTLDLDDDDDDDDDDNDYAMYHYNQQQQHRYGNSYDNDFTNPPPSHESHAADATGFADFDNTPTFDAAFADFTTVPHDSSNASDSVATFDAHFDNNMDTFASFPESNFADVDNWSTATTPSQSDDPFSANNAGDASTSNTTSTGCSSFLSSSHLLRWLGGDDIFDPFGTNSSL
jgi:hypothetical protein